MDCRELCVGWLLKELMSSTNFRFNFMERGKRWNRDRIGLCLPDFRLDKGFASPLRGPLSRGWSLQQPQVNLKGWLVVDIGSARVIAGWFTKLIGHQYRIRSSSDRLLSLEDEHRNQRTWITVHIGSYILNGYSTCGGALADVATPVVGAVRQCWIGSTGAASAEALGAAVFSDPCTSPPTSAACQISETICLEQ